MRFKLIKLTMIMIKNTFNLVKTIEHKLNLFKNWLTITNRFSDRVKVFRDEFYHTLAYRDLFCHSVSYRDLVHHRVSYRDLFYHSV